MTDNATLPPLPSDSDDDRAWLSWEFDALRAGYEETGNGFFVFRALLVAARHAFDYQDQRIDLPEWVPIALTFFATRLEKARGLAEVADAIDMHGKTAARDSRQVEAWMDTAVRAAMVDWLVAHGHMQDRAAAALHVAKRSGISPDALRKRIDRLFERGADLSLDVRWPPIGGHTSPK